MVRPCDWTRHAVPLQAGAHEALTILNCGGRTTPGVIDVLAFKHGVAAPFQGRTIRRPGAFDRAIPFGLARLHGAVVGYAPTLVIFRAGRVPSVRVGDRRIGRGFGCCVGRWWRGGVGHGAGVRVGLRIHRRLLGVGVACGIRQGGGGVASTAAHEKERHQSSDEPTACVAKEWEWELC